MAEQDILLQGPYAPRAWSPCQDGYPYHFEAASLRFVRPKQGERVPYGPAVMWYLQHMITGYCPLYDAQSYAGPGTIHGQGYGPAPPIGEDQVAAWSIGLPGMGETLSKVKS
jgi:hypothetical protein